ncbi:M48 family metallopeptidase [Bacteroidales bacterium OttesenSCG-928-M11]|nr:M48 family metallopeptidase [Bacteroidales bacterium OttesenSCG-928-M11]
MKYVGIQTQKRENNFRSILLLCLFPVLVLLLIFLFFFILGWFSEVKAMPDLLSYSLGMTISTSPYVGVGVLLWFLIAYFANTSIIASATNSHTLDRTQNKRVYNLVENLCISQGMKMPKVNIIEDESLNAFASGINEKTYTVTLTRGIINKLDDAELEGVIAHELSHIRNSDVRLLIVSIVFVGIFSMVAQVALNSLRYSALTSSSRRSSNDKNGGAGAIVIILILALVAFIGYFIGGLMRFAISRKREYLADAGAAEMTKNPLALASALRKISDNPNVQSIKRDDVAQLFIEHPNASNKSFLSGLSGLFATHPPIEKRIQTLEQF